MNEKTGLDASTDKIREGLMRNNLTVVWLISQLEKRGIDTNSDEMSKIFRRKRNGAKVEKIITESLVIIEKYEHLFAAVS